MNSLLALLHVSKSFDGRKVLSNITLRFPGTGFIGIQGPSGCGKSTLLSLIALLQKPDEGSIFYGENETRNWTLEESDAFRLEHIGFSIQKDELLGLEDSLSNVALPLKALENGNGQEKKAKAPLFLLGMKDKEKADVLTLSGGEKQRVNLARSLVTSPKILLLDEPTSALDEERSEEVLSLFARLSKTRLVLLVSHDGARMKRYVDRLLTLEDGKIVKDERFERPRGSRLNLTPLEKKKEKASLPLKSILSYALRKRKAHPWRCRLIEASLSFGLLGLGFSAYLSSSLQKEIRSAFSSFIPPHAIVMEKESQGNVEWSLGSKEEARLIQETFPEEVYAVGQSYLYDFEDSFVDDRYFYYRSGVSEKMLPLFSARNINDFLFLKDDVEVYPTSIGSLAWDEVVLGLPYDTMALLCRDFGVAKGYEYLGRRLEQKPLDLDFRLANLSWNLEENLLLQAIGVVPSKLPLIYHVDPLWNQKVFGDYFHLKDAGTEVPTTAQEAQSLPFLELKGSTGDFLKKIRTKEGMGSFGFDIVNGENAPSLCEAGKATSYSRLFLYESSNRGIPFASLDQAMERSSVLKGRLPTWNGGYFASVESAISGFSGRFFLTNGEEKATLLERTYSDLPLEEAGLLGSLPEQTVEGSVLSSGSGGMKISADLSWQKKKELGLDEVSLSRGLFKKLGKPSSIYVVAETAQEVVHQTLSRSFARKEVQIAEIKEAEQEVLYVPCDWTVDFFVNSLGCSPLVCEPTGAIFYCEEGASESIETERLSKLFPEFRFGSPSALIEGSLKDTTSYLSSVLLLFSGITLGSSTLLFIFVWFVDLQEGKKEAHSLRVLGLSEKEVSRFTFWNSYLRIGSGFLGAFLALLVVEIAVSFVLASIFKTAVKIRISLLPFFVLLLSTLVFIGFIRLFAPFLSEEKTGKVRKKFSWFSSKGKEKRSP